MQKKVSILYYSGAGNTKFIAKNIRLQLEALSYNVKFTNINSKTVQNIVFNEDIYIVGFPVYDLSAPKLVQEFVEIIKDRNKPIAYFCTKAFMSVNSIYELKQISDKNGLKTVASLDLFMPATDALALFAKKNSKTEKILKSFHSKRINNKIKKFISHIERNKEKKISKKWYGYLSFLIPKKTRKSFHDQYTKYIPMLHSIDNLCNQCMLCVNNCPRENIRFEEAIKFGLNCDMCLKCLHHCHTEAIQLGEYTKGNVRYNKVIINKM